MTLLIHSKNLEISLENSSKQSEIREKVVLNLRTGFNQQKHVNFNDRNLNSKIAKTKAFIKNNPDMMFITSAKET